MEKMKGCPHCGSEVTVYAECGLHVYTCTNEECRAVISFAGNHVVGTIGGFELGEAKNHLERFNRREKMK